MLFSDACADFLAHIKYERGLAARTVDTYSDWLSTYRRWADDQNAGNNLDERFNTTLLRRYLYAMSKRGLRPRTIRNAFAPLKSLGAFLVEQKAIEINSVLALGMPKKDAPYRPLVSRQEILALLDAVEKIRDTRRRSLGRAIILILALTGIRFQELLDLEVSDVRLDLRTLTIRHGKGDKARTLHPSSQCLQALTDWLQQRECIGANHNWLWAFDTRRRMGEVGVRQLLEDIKAIAGLESHKNIMPHAFRRFFASNLVQQAGLQATSKALGHSELNTTYQYLSLNEEPAQGMSTLTLTPSIKDNNPACREKSIKRIRHAGKSISRGN